MKIFGKKIALFRYTPHALGVGIILLIIGLAIFPSFFESSLGLDPESFFMIQVFGLSCLSLVINRKKVHALILRSFIGPFLISFAVILFVLVLQFLAKYMEDIMGKGLEGHVLLQVFGLACLTLVTMALPLGILLSSLLTMGNMGERYELAALKSSGISLFGIIRPLIHVTLVVATGSVLFSFYVMPMANLKLYTLLFDLSKVKPTFALKANHFYGGIDGMVVHVGDINRETDVLYRVKIYDHSDQVGNNRVTVAKTGRMVPGQDEGYLDMRLYNGVIHESKKPEPGEAKGVQYQRFYFDTLKYKVPLQGFDLEKTDEETFSTHQFMLNISELGAATDSIYNRRSGYLDDYTDFNRKYVHLDTIMNKSLSIILNNDTLKYGASGTISPDANKPVWDWFPEVQAADLVAKTINQVQAMENYTKIVEDRLDREGKKWRKFRSEQHMRWMLPVSCLVFLFLGASLGAIIRKGGVGIPVIFSIVFFILFYILMIQGKKFARDEILPIWAGIWLPILVMGPLGLYFAYQSVTEAPLLYSANWYAVGRFLFGWLPFKKKKKAPARHTLTLDEMVKMREKSKTDAREAIEDYESKKK